MNAPAIIICAKVEGRLRPGSVAGYECTQCGCPVQVTVPGLEQIRTLGAHPFCNACGFALAEELHRSDLIELAQINPAAQEELDRRRSRN